MANFDLAFAFLMGNEGEKLLDDPKTGEYSRFGITLATASGFKLCAPDDRSFIDDLTVDRAKDFYLDYFWKPMKLDNLRVQAVADKILDMGVNMGPTQAAKIVQRACAALGGRLAVDGVLGYGTVIVINVRDGNQLLLELRAESLQFYRDLVTGNPDKYEKYWEDWKERAEK